MLRPSQKVLFRSMPTLNTFKIHPPLPLNPRESKQLLNLLTASFRQQLDAEHGDFKASNAHKGTDKSKRRTRSFSDSSGRPTDRHMDSVLTNPLFALNTVGKASTMKRDPMEVFDIAVAKGMMTINYARACLTAQKYEIIQSPVPTIRQGMRESGAGLKVLKWLISSGTANNNDFLRETRFAQTFMEYLVAEGLQEVCWKWIQRAFQQIPEYLASPSAPDGSEAQAQRRRLRREIAEPLYHLVRAEASGGRGDVSLDSAYLCMSRAVDSLKGVPQSRLRDFLTAPGWFLVQKTVNLHSERPLPSASAFDSFYSLVPVLFRDPTYQLAHLGLHHPSRPNVDLALVFLRQLNPGFSFTKIRDHAYVQLGLDTAKILLENGRYGDAEWVMDFLRENYSQILGMNERDQLVQAKAEASSLQLLEGLSLA